MIVAWRYDIINLATKAVMKRARSDGIENKEIQGRLISENNWFPGKWVRSGMRTRFCVPMI